MSVLNGLRAAWVRLIESKSTGDIVYSEDNKLIKEKLNELLKRLINNVDKDNGIEMVLNEIKDNYINNRNEKKSNWHYKLVRLDIDNANDNGNHLFELFIENKKVIEVVINIGINGDILDFSIKYLVNVPEYINYRPCEGTKMIKMTWMQDGIIEYFDNIYSLDLLNNSYSDEEIKDNCVSNGKITFTRKKH